MVRTLDSCILLAGRQRRLIWMPLRTCMLLGALVVQEHTIHHTAVIDRDIAEVMGVKVVVTWVIADLLTQHHAPWKCHKLPLSVVHKAMHAYIS